MNPTYSLLVLRVFHSNSLPSRAIMVLGKPKPAYALTAVPRLLPKPPCFCFAAAGSPWIAIDPVLRADCVSLCRSVQLAFVAFLALLAGSKSAFAANPSASPHRIESTRQQRTAGALEQRNCVERRQASVSPQRREERPFSTRERARVRSSFDPLIPTSPQLNLERAHAPPAVSITLLPVFISFRTITPSHSGLQSVSRVHHLSLPSLLSSTFHLPLHRNLALRAEWLPHYARTFPLSASLRPHSNLALGGIFHVCC